MNKRLVLAQFGCGYWGPNLLRNFSVLPDCSVKYVADKSPDRRALLAGELGNAGEKGDEVLLLIERINRGIAGDAAETVGMDGLFTGQTFDRTAKR